MINRVTLKRFSTFADLTDSETAALRNMLGPAIDHSAGRYIRQEGEPVGSVFFLHDGWAVSYGTLPDGGRQVLKVHLAGDILGAPSVGLQYAGETLRSLTDVVVSVVPLTALRDIFETMPRLAMLFFLAAQEERLILMDRLMSIGRQRGVVRLAAFLLHVYDRLSIIGKARKDCFELPMSQELIGDVIGMTVVHANRMFSELEARGLVMRKARHIHFPDIPLIRKFAAQPQRQVARNALWLPSQR